MPDAQDDPALALVHQQAELVSLLEGLAPGDWHRPSPCEGWDVADVVLHLAQTNEMAVGSLRGHLDRVLEDLTAGVGPAASVDDGAAAMVARDRGAGPAAAHCRLLASIEALRAAASFPCIHARVAWVAGELAARTLVTTRLAETWIHTGDIAAAVDVELAPTDRIVHIARLAWRTLPYAFAQDGGALAGPVAFDLGAPSGETWAFVEGEPTTTIVGPAIELCAVAARRVDPASTALVAKGPDGADVLRLVRTYA